VAVEAAWDEGFHSGYREGLRAAREQQEAATLRLIQLAQQAFMDAHEFTHKLERDLVGLSLAIAERVTESAMRVDPAAVVEVVRAALAEVQHTTVIQVRVNPEDHELVAVQWERLLPRASLRGAELVPDEKVQRGGCVIETVTGTADGQLATKFTQIAQMFEAVAEGDAL
jgi:flagellar assembly protein FliH